MDNSKKNIYGKRGMLWKGSLQERVSWLRVTAAGDGANQSGVIVLRLETFFSAKTG